MTDDNVPMTSHRPYLLRALYEWIADNGMTPHLLVDATRPAVQVPASAVKEGKIVLNIAQRAVSRLEMSNDGISFSARFGGVSQTVRVPVAAVLAIYARETGQGMALPEDSGALESATTEDDSSAESARPNLSAVPSAPDANDGPDDDGPDNPDPPRTGHLRVVK